MRGEHCKGKRWLWVRKEEPREANAGACIFRFLFRRYNHNMTKREHFLHSGAVKVLPNEENAPGLSVTAREELFHYLNKSHTLKVVRR